MAVGVALGAAWWTRNRPSAGFAGATRDEMDGRWVLADAATSPPATPEQTDIAALLRETLDQASNLRARFSERPGACHALALANYELGHTAEATRCWKQALALEPSYREAHRWLAYVAMDQGEYTRARAAYRRWLTLEPSSVDARFGLAEASLNLGDLETARRLLSQELLPSGPEAAPAYLLLGQIYLELRQYRPARENFLKASQLMPRAPQPYYGLSTVCARLGDTERSQVYRDQFRELSQAEGRRHIEAKGPGADLAAVRRKVAQILSMIGETYAACGDPRAAETLAQRAAALNRK